MTREIESLIVGACLVAAGLVLLVSLWVLSSGAEARAFERVTGKHVSTWDAMWLDLRVQEQTEKK